MILHTLIENGLSHAYQTGEDGTFKLTYEKNKSGIQYELQNDGSQLEKLSRQPDEKINEGMGMKYVKTRLEESYPKRWDLTYGLQEHVWKVKIKINLS